MITTLTLYVAKSFYIKQKFKLRKMWIFKGSAQNGAGKS
jgi:predicted ATPase